MQSRQYDTLLGGAAVCDAQFQQDLVDLGRKLSISKENCIRAEISLNELLYEIEEFIKIVRDRISMKRTFAYRENLDVVIDKFSNIIMDMFPSPEPRVSKACFESLVLGKDFKSDCIPKLSCLSPIDMSSFFFKTAHIFQQLNKSKHSFLSEFSDAQVGQECPAYSRRAQEGLSACFPMRSQPRRPTDPRALLPLRGARRGRGCHHRPPRREVLRVFVVHTVS